MGPEERIAIHSADIAIVVAQTNPEPSLKVTNKPHNEALVILGCGALGR
jgi:hypothetical protein